MKPTAAQLSEEDMTAQNTDTKLWQQPTTTFHESEGETDSGMEPYVFVTKDGGIGFNHYGTCQVMPIEGWMKLSQELATLQQQHEAELRELKKDKERLDFLDRCNHVLNKQSGTSYGWELILNHNVNRLMRENHLDDIDLNDSKAHGAKSCRDVLDEKLKSLSTTSERKNAHKS